VLEPDDSSLHRVPEVVVDGNLYPRRIRLEPHVIKRLFELGGESRAADEQAQDNQEAPERMAEELANQIRQRGFPCAATPSRGNGCAMTTVLSSPLGNQQVTSYSAHVADSRPLHWMLGSVHLVYTYQTEVPKRPDWPVLQVNRGPA